MSDIQNVKIYFTKNKKILSIMTGQNIYKIYTKCVIFSFAILIFLFIEQIKYYTLWLIIKFYVILKL